MIDQYNRKIEYLRLSVTDRCNLRCKYCMPESGCNKLRHEDILTFEEILMIVRALAGLGIRKVRLTGGEPLLRKGIIKLIRDIKAVDGIEQVMLTTNGIMLHDMMDDLICAGLDGINLSLDTLNSNIFKKITRRNLFNDVQLTLNKVLNSKIVVKINCVPITGINDDDIIKIADLARYNDIKVRFIELMPIGCAVNFKGIPTDNIKTQIESRYGKLDPVSPTELQGPAKYYKLSGFIGQVGLIDAIEHKFCSSCNRIRLTANGFLKPCLNSEACFDLKTFTRDQRNSHELTRELQDMVYRKPREHHFEKLQNNDMMYQIGG